MKHNLEFCHITHIMSRKHHVNRQFQKSVTQTVTSKKQLAPYIPFHIAVTFHSCAWVYS